MKHLFPDTRDQICTPCRGSTVPWLLFKYRWFNWLLRSLWLKNFLLVLGTKNPLLPSVQLLITCCEARLQSAWSTTALAQHWPLHICLLSPPWAPRQYARAGLASPRNQGVLPVPPLPSPQDCSWPLEGHWNQSFYHSAFLYDFFLSTEVLTICST